MNVSAAIDQLTPEERAALHDKKIPAEQIAQSVLKRQLPPTNLLKYQQNQQREMNKLPLTRAKTAHETQKTHGATLDVHQKAVDLTDSLISQPKQEMEPQL